MSRRVREVNAAFLKGESAARLGLDLERAEGAYLYAGPAPRRTWPMRRVEPLRIRGRLYVQVGGIYGDTRCSLKVLPLWPIKEFVARFGRGELRYQPDIDNPADQYAGLVVRAGRRLYAIGHVSEQRRLLFIYPVTRRSR